MLGLKFANKEDIKVLFLGAHCDDIEIGCGGTILKLIDTYKISHIKWIVFASNEIREKEAKKSAGLFLENIKSRDIIIKEYRDGFLPFIAAEIKDYFEEIKKRFDPDVIFTHFRNDRHQDHRLVSDLTWNTWRNHFILEYEIPKYDGDLGIPNLYVPIEEKYLKKKNGILIEAYESQRSKHWFDEKTFEALPRLRGMESAVTFAEAFYARKLIL